MPGHDILTEGLRHMALMTLGSDGISWDQGQLAATWLPLQLTKRASLKILKCAARGRASEALVASVAESAGLPFCGKADKRKGLELIGGMRILPSPSGCPYISAGTSEVPALLKCKETLFVFVHLSVPFHGLSVCGCAGVCKHAFI